MDGKIIFATEPLAKRLSGYAFLLRSIEQDSLTQVDSGCLACAQVGEANRDTLFEQTPLLKYTSFFPEMMLFCNRFVSL